MIDLNLRPETLKLLLEKIGIGIYFLHRTPIAQEIIERTDKWGCIKFNVFCTSKGAITRIKRKPTGWKTILIS
jgi:hypothetical protein